MRQHLTRITFAETSNTPRSLRVFLCHASEDKAAVRALYHRLCSDGVKPWLDEEDLLPGQEWQYEIPRVVRESDVVIACLSRSFITKAGYRNTEIKLALDVADEQPEGSIFIIPLKLEECQVPERLRRWHWVNFFDTRGYERLIRALRVRAEEIGANTALQANRRRHGLVLAILIAFLILMLVHSQVFLLPFTDTTSSSATSVLQRDDSSPDAAIQPYTRTATTLVEAADDATAMAETRQRWQSMPVSLPLIAPPSPIQSAKLARVTSYGLNMRAQPGDDQPIIVALFNGARVRVTNQVQQVGDVTWVKIQLCNREGWVAETHVELIDVSPPESPVGCILGVGPSPLNVREQPDQYAGIIAQLSEGTYVHLLNSHQDEDGQSRWQHIRFQGGEGWVDVSFIEQIE